MVDITTELFNLPEVTTDPLYAKVVHLDISEVTEGKVAGQGAFDRLMVSMKAHLKTEYEAGRITGSEYTKAYIELTQAAMQFAMQFVLGKDQVFWASQQAQIQAISGRIAMEKARWEYQNALPAQLTLTQEQTKQIQMQTALAKEQIEVQRAQTCDSRTDGATVVGLVGKQKALYSQQITSYQRDAEVKAAKIFSDAWVTQKTIDEGLTAPTGFTNASLDTILTKLKTNNGLT